VINHADAQHRRQAERARESKRMKERQDTQHAIAATQPKDLLQLFKVRPHVIVAQHHALGIARAAAGEDHGGQVFQAGFFLRAQDSLQPTIRHQPGDERGGKFFADARSAGLRTAGWSSRFSVPSKQAEA